MAHACIDGDDNCRYATGQRDDVEDDLRDGELGRQSAAHCGLVLDVKREGKWGTKMKS